MSLARLIKTNTIKHHDGTISGSIGSIEFQGTTYDVTYTDNGTRKALHSAGFGSVDATEERWSEMLDRLDENGGMFSPATR